MTRLFDRAIVDGCRPLDAGSLHQGGMDLQQVRAEFMDAEDPAGAQRQALANARAAKAVERVSADDLGGATVFVADEVGRYWSTLPQETDISDLVASVMLPFEKVWIEFQGVPNELAARAWGVLLELLYPLEEDLDHPWALRGQLVVEWTKGKPIGPVATYTLPLDAQGMMADSDSEGRGAIDGWLPAIPGMPIDESHEWADGLCARYLGPALFAVSLLHCKNVDWVENEPGEKLSKRHRRHTGKALARYFTLDIAPMRRVLEAEGDPSGSGLRQALHICRGHFKTYGPEAPLFGHHTGTYWWPSYARGDRKLGEITKDYRIRIEHEGLGRSYRTADEHPELVSRSEGRGEPDLSGRGLAAHSMVQNLLSEAVAAAGHQPLSPRPEDPQFDLAWETSEFVWLVEVKSLTPANEESQLRAGLAQLLRYRQLLDAGNRQVRCILAVEVPPTDIASDKSWLRLCEDEGISLVWPETFGLLLAGV